VGVSEHSPYSPHLDGKRFADEEEVETEVTVTPVKKIFVCEFRRTDKATGQVYQCW
jgi:hypothetical protein